MSAAAGGLLAFLAVVGATASGVLYDTLTSPVQVVVVATVFLLICWAMGHLLERGTFGIGVGLAVGGVVSAVVAGTGGHGGYAVALLWVAAVGVLVLRVEQRERGGP
jgi:hypothetical protein